MITKNVFFIGNKKQIIINKSITTDSDGNKHLTINYADNHSWMQDSLKISLSMLEKEVNNLKETCNN